MSTKASITQVIFLALVSLVTKHASAQPPTEPTFVYSFCDLRYDNFTSNSAYNINLNTVLTTLQTSSTSAMFSNTTTGMGPDTVYGQYHCRGDIGSKLCGSCIQAASKAAMTVCPLAKAAVVWYAECTLRYQNQTMVGLVDPPNYYIYLNTAANETDPTSFSTVLNNTMVPVAQAAWNSPKKFATGEGKVSATETVYTLVQCSPLLSTTECQSCVVSAANVLVSCCGEWPKAIFVFRPTCQMMYSTLGAFYFTPNAPPSSTPPASLFFHPVRALAPIGG